MNLIRIMLRFFLHPSLFFIALTLFLSPLFLAASPPYTGEKKASETKAAQSLPPQTATTNENNKPSPNNNNTVYNDNSANNNANGKAFTYRFGPLAENIAQMERDGVVRSYRFTLLLFRLLRLETKIKKGIYTFHQSDSLAEIIRRLSKGEEDTHLITIPEGFDIYDIDARLLSLGLIANRFDFVTLCANHPRLGQLNHALQLKGKARLPSLEGVLTPESYRVAASVAPEQLIALASDEFLRKILPYLQKKAPPAKWKDLLTIASLVEKETIVAGEKPIIAGVVYNRLDIGMKLRYDPTIIYAMKKENIYLQNLKNGAVNIKKSHFLIPSPYNTYYSKGLPPGPIASPTLSSVIAAVNPAKNDYLFFVAKAKGSPELGHAFSKTYEEHRVNIKRYLGR